MSEVKKVQTRKNLENVSNVDLIGKISHQITGAKLPSNRQVLQLLFYNMRFVYRNLRQSAKLTINAAIIFWQQAHIPTKDVARCVDKLENLYKCWQNIKKTAPNKRSETQKKTVKIFVEDLDNLFDIAHRDALILMKIKEDKEFLLLQKQKGRPGCMAGVDMVLSQRQNRAEQRKEKESSRKSKYEQMMQESRKFIKQNKLLNFSVLFNLFFIFF